MDSRVYWIWLAQALQPGSRAAGPLLEHFACAADIHAASEAQLRQAGVSPAVMERLCDRSLTEAHAVLDRVLAAGDWLLTPEDALYPDGLRRMADPPVVLYCRGTLPDLNTRPALAVVGTRHPSQEGQQEAWLLAAGLAAGGITVISGGAVGIDAAAHSGAMAGGGITLAVMACPLDVEYPRENAALRRQIVQQGGALLSEYPPGLPYQCVFPVRNRLLAGLTLGVCLAETPARSGARITARLARENDRDVFALPGALLHHRNDGAHREIRGGATLVTRAADIIEEYAPLFPGLLDAEAAIAAEKRLAGKQPAEQPEKAPRGVRKAKSRRRPAAQPEEPPVLPASPAVLPAEASAAAAQVYAALGNTPQPVDQLAGATGLPVPALLAALTELEMLGCACNSAGQQYARVRQG